jgi:hypothetical protein
MRRRASLLPGDLDDQPTNDETDYRQRTAACHCTTTNTGVPYFLYRFFLGPVSESAMLRFRPRILGLWSADRRFLGAMRPLSEVGAVPIVKVLYQTVIYPAMNQTG